MPISKRRLQMRTEKHIPHINEYEIKNFIKLGAKLGLLIPLLHMGHSGARVFVAKGLKKLKLE